MLRYILGPSPLVSTITTIRKLNSNLSFRGGSTKGQCFSDEISYEFLENLTDSNKPERLTQSQLQKILSTNAKKLTKQQRLLKSVLDEANLSRTVSAQNLKNLEEVYEVKRKYKRYLRIKRLIPLSLVGPFTGNELSKMAYAAALGSKSVSLTLPGLIGYSLPAFFFFHMTSYYAPDKFKPLFEIGKYTLGAPFWVASTMADELTAGPEEFFFGEDVPLDVSQTGGTIPHDLGDVNQLRELITELKGDFKKKTY